MNRSSCKCRRCGFTLIEVAIVVSITSVLFAVSITTIVSLLRVQRQFEADASQDAALARLADRLRADAHAALSADCTNGCTLDLGDRASVLYLFDAPAVVREVRRGDAVEHRDSFVLAKDAAVEFSSESIGEKELVTVKVRFSSPGSSVTSSTQPLEVLAAVNLHGRP